MSKSPPLAGITPAHFDFFSLVLPIAISLFVIAFIWIAGWFVSFLIKLKTKKILRSEVPAKDHLKASFIHFVTTYGRLFKKSVRSLLWLLTAYVVLLCADVLLNFFSFHLTHLVQKEEGGTFFVSTDVLLRYVSTAQKIVQKVSHTLVMAYAVLLCAVWAIYILRHALEAIIRKASRAGRAADRERTQARSRTLNNVVGNLLKVVILLVAVFTVLQNLGVNLTALLATAGLASVAVGLGAQSLIKDVISGFFILFEDQFAVGDKIEVNGVVGVVEGMTLRSVCLRGNEGSLNMIPNGEIRVVKNYTSPHAYFEIKVFVPLTPSLQQILLDLKREVEAFAVEFHEQVLADPEVRSFEKIVDFECKTISVLFRAIVRTDFSDKVKLEMLLNERLVRVLQDYLVDVPAQETV